MTLAQLQYFQTLAHVLHYTRAAEALPYAALLYTIPVCYLFTKKKFYPKD